MKHTLGFGQLFTMVFTFVFSGLFAQSTAPGNVLLDDLGYQGVSMVWQPAQFTTHPTEVDGVTYQFIRVGGLSHTGEVGKPAMPQYHELVAIPRDADVQFRVVRAVYEDHPAAYPVHPALQPATDTYGAPEPEFEIDQDFYNIDQYYPQSVVSRHDIQYRREMPFATFTFHPVQYNPVQGMLRFYTEIEVEITFHGGSSFLKIEHHTQHFLNLVSRPFLNRGSIEQEIAAASSQINQDPLSPDYIMITHIDYMAAAERLAAWKTQLGHRVELIDGTGWTHTMIRTEVRNRYNSYYPKPDFLLIIGDHPDIPGQVINGPYGTYATDHYYVCMGPTGDYIADMAKGRISVANATQANNVVDKIIQYETDPPTDPLFYSTGVHAAYFQHAGNGFAERRFAQTAEETRTYMMNTQGYDVTRVYVTGSSVNPTNWNNGLYSSGEPVPMYLRKPTFPWNGSATHINNAINSGASYVLHRDHGFETGWGDPYYTNGHINLLNNGNKTPIVFTINCLTGKFLHNECFAERFLRKYPGGAVGVFAHAEISLSGYNDALAFGLFDAIWASPGCIPVFTGSGGQSLNNPPPHAPILTMGDVTNHATLRMNQTWAPHQYSHALFHYFGDPAMRMYTRPPTTVTATHLPAIQCGSDTTFSISTNLNTGTVTLIVDDEVVSTGSLMNGNTTLTFPQLSGNYALLTISDTNAIAYVDTIFILGGCPKSSFQFDATTYCVAETIEFTDHSSGNITSYQWDFGSGAVPATATGAGPHQVNYNYGGTKTVTLTVSGAASHTSSTQIWVDSICRFTIPATGNTPINHCTGQLQDDGGDFHYSNNSDGSVTIAPPGAAAINLLFSRFDFEHNADYLRVYDGPNTSSPLIGSFTGNELPGYHGMVSSTGGAITLHQETSSENSYPGFTLMFWCAAPNAVPHPNFIVTDSNVCIGEFTFTDLTFNDPGSWLWDFGDGNTSSLQNPQHQYQQNGLFNVTLTATNQHGSDSVTRYGVVNVNMPLTPVANDVIRCMSGSVSLQASSNGSIEWYTQPTGGTPVATGPTYNTPQLTQNTTYYVESVLPSPLQYGAKPDNLGGGGYLNFEHYLRFDALQPFRLTTVKVYAQNGGNRTVELRNSTGGLIQGTTLFIPEGESRITLNFDVPAGNNLRLVCAGTPRLYRNNGGLSFPYELPGIFSIHSTSATSNPTGFYYFFYDWEVQLPPCRSARVSVEAILSDTLVPVPDFTYTINTNQVLFANTSQFAQTYMWHFGDGGTSTLHHPFYVYHTPGTWDATLIATNACGTDSITQAIAITTGIEEEDGTGALRWYPNPASNLLYLEYTANTPGQMQVSFTDPSGRLVKVVHLETQQGVNHFPLDISTLTPGVWLMHCVSEEMNKTEKVIVAP